MKVLYIHQYFKTPEEGGAIRSWYIASFLSKAGFDVEMVTAHDGKSYIHKDINGISVHYLPVKYDNSFGFFRRVISFLLFAHKAYNLSRTIPDIDFAYITSTPLTVGLIALRLKSKKKIPYVFEVRDLWPEAPIQLGSIKNSLVKKLAKKLEYRIYRKASGIIALSPGIQSYVNRLFPEKRVHLCPNISDCSFFDPQMDKNSSLITRFDLSGKLVISYFGAIGWVNALHYLLDLTEAAESTHQKIHVFIIGKGAKKEDLVKDLKKRGIHNIQFIDHLNKYELKKYLAVSDAAYISFANYPVLEYNSPNKFFDALASGKLVVSNVSGWIRELIEKHECGIYYDPEKPVDGLEKLKSFLSDREMLDRYKKNARDLALSDFERGKLVPALVEFLKSLY